jgi:hypothetical protein
MLISVLFTVCCSSVKAQLFYYDSHLFIGQKATLWQNVGLDPMVLIGPSWGMEFFEDGLNFWRLFGATNWGNYKIFIDGSGKVGIGMKPSTSTASILQVYGSVWTPNGVLTPSDESLKKILQI